MKNIVVILSLTIVFFAGCASGGKSTKKIVIWETTTLPRNYEVIGPVNVSEQIQESTEDTIQGLAGFIGKDGRVSGQIPAEMKTALDVKREAYKERIFDKLGEKAKDYEADAVIGAEYMYVPPYASFSKKATVTAKGTMVKYKS
jgi:uncharacterized protein YbjQ (UPF0145 family)